MRLTINREASDKEWEEETVMKGKVIAGYFGLIVTEGSSYLTGDQNEKSVWEPRAKYASLENWQKKWAKAGMNLSFSMRCFLVILKFLSLRSSKHITCNSFILTKLN